MLVSMDPTHPEVKLEADGALKGEMGGLRYSKSGRVEQEGNGPPPMWS